MRAEYLFTKPIEMPRGSHYGSNYWIMPSRKLGRNVIAFSNLEHAYQIMLEMDPSVEYYCEQPLKETVILDGKKRETVFDIYVYYKDGTDCLREVKYSTDLEAAMSDTESRIAKQIEAQSTISKRLGISYGIVTERDIYKGNYTILNLELLAAKSRRFNKFDKDQEKSFIEYLKNQNGSLTVGNLIDRGRLSSLSGMDLIADLCYKGQIIIENIDTVPLGFKSEVSVCTNH